LYRDCQNLFELATKPCSIVFNAYREDSYIEGGEDYLTFSGLDKDKLVNIENYKKNEFEQKSTVEGGTYFS
jgi:hypothetical protein